MYERRPELYGGIALDTYSQFEPEALLGLVGGREFGAATLQFRPDPGKVEENVRSMLALMEQAVGLAARRNVKLDLVVLPELASSGVICDAGRAMTLAEELSGFTVQALVRGAREMGLYVVAGLPEREGSRFYNTAVLVGPEGLVGRYRKVHLAPRDRNWAHEGRAGFGFYDLPFARVGLLLGYDLFFPESVENLSKQGVDILCVPALWDDEKSRFIWEARVAEQVHMAVANQWGTLVDGHSACGGSLVLAYARYAGECRRVVSPSRGDHINLLVLNPGATRQKRFLEHVDYSLLLGRSGGSCRK
ncbi:carbon-nitrogen hydrolase family protein [Desulfofundulus sp.]|uniref:carbon-nitrogen hydrolase family protein n=1 Tax=Desulfofundulus sp. TaxID=2282750 RepID=UPI003C749B90